MGKLSKELDEIYIFDIKQIHLYLFDPWLYQIYF